MRVKDDGTREILGPILAESEEHVDWLETQLCIIAAIGFQNYLSEEMGGTDEYDDEHK
jgi:bacterioferritin